METRAFNIKNVIKLSEDDIRQALVSNGLDEKEHNRVLTFRISRDSVDRYGSVLSLRGWKLKNYRDNPVFLYQHNKDCMSDSIQTPVGRSIKEWINLPEYMDADPSKIEGHIRSSPIPEDDETGLYQLVWFADTKEGEATLQAFNKRLLNTVSAGFLPIKRINKDKIPDKYFENQGKITSFLSIETELLESSAVTIPGQVQAKAIRSALDAGFNTEFLDVLNINPINEKFGNIRGAVEAVNSLIENFPDLAKRIGQIENTVNEQMALIRSLVETNSNSKPNDINEDVIVAAIRDLKKGK